VLKSADPTFAPGGNRHRDELLLLAWQHNVEVDAVRQKRLSKYDVRA
jgi:hypothetical protein